MAPKCYFGKLRHLAEQPAELAALRERLAVQRTGGPLFDAARFVRNLERAMQAMGTMSANGQAPRPIVLGEP